MSGDGNWLQSIGQLGDLARVAVDKISSAIGMVYEPTHIRRIARAQADGMRILAEGEVDATDIHMRAAIRIEKEHVRQQETIEEVTRQALPHLTEKAEPSKVEDDWLIHFFGLARDVTKDDMRQTWGRILAGELNRPGSFSRRTLNIIAQIDAHQAQLFNTICCFSMHGGDQIIPLILNLDESIYANTGLNFAALSDLDGLGLIKFDNLAGYRLQQQPKRLGVIVQKRFLALEFKQDANNFLPIGKVMLTSAGRQLAGICETLPIAGFEKYLKAEWAKSGITVSVLGVPPPGMT